MTDPFPPDCLVRVIKSAGDEGRGFMCRGFPPYIITAAHCLPRLPDPNEPFGDPLLVQVESLRTGAATKLLVVFADPCSDLAILGDATRLLELEELDYHAAERWMSLQMELMPVALNMDAVTGEDGVPVKVFSCDGEWIHGTASNSCNTPMMTVEFERVVPVGTSGSPIFDDHGAVVGVVSTQIESSTPEDVSVHFSRAVALQSALPGWLSEALDEVAKSS